MSTAAHTAALTKLTAEERRGERAVDRPMAKLIAAAIEQAGIRPSQKRRQVGDLQLGELLDEGHGLPGPRRRASALPRKDVAGATRCGRELPRTAHGDQFAAVRRRCCPCVALSRQNLLRSGLLNQRNLHITRDFTPSRRADSNR
jgi:hypothetical protein